jgi:hypothetical protein
MHALHERPLNFQKDGFWLRSSKEPIGMPVSKRNILQRRRSNISIRRTNLELVWLGIRNLLRPDLRIFAEKSYHTGAFRVEHL